jgi:hypothetical protein
LLIKRLVTFSRSKVKLARKSAVDSCGIDAFRIFARGAPFWPVRVRVLLRVASYRPSGLRRYTTTPPDLLSAKAKT